MPATPDARGSNRARRSAPATPIECASRYETQAAFTHDRIRQWQTLGSVAVPPDAMSVVSVPQSALYAAPSTPSSPIQESNRAHGETNTDRKGRRATRQADLDREEWLRRGRASTPKKRVVSDDHWRQRQHSRSKIEDNNEQSEIHTGSLTDHPSRTTEAESGMNALNARFEREQRRKRRTQARRQQRQDENGRYSGGDTSTADRPNTAEDEALTRNGMADLVDDADSNAPQRSELMNDESQQRLSFSDAEQTRSAADSGNPGVGQSRYATALGQPPTYEYEPSLPRKGVLSKTRQMFGVNHPSQAASNRLPSIEAWLDEQPDPFVESNEDVFSIDCPVEKHRACRPQRRRSHGGPPQAPPEIADPNKIWDSVGESIENHITPVEHKQKLADRDSAAPSLSPVGLKRGGAHSKKPRRQSKYSHLEDERQSRHSSMPIQSTKPHRQQDVSNLSPIMPIDTRREPPRCSTEAEQSLGHPCMLKRKLTTHEDLMSQLSVAKPSRSVRRKQDVKTYRPAANAEDDQLTLAAIKADEAMYGRELRTLVDGVIPVLLQCVLSKNNSKATAALFTPSSADTGTGFAQSIVDMGIALERLKSLHNRIPLQKVESLLSWCQSAHRTYSDYVKAWRLGFQDIVVNLAPLKEGEEHGDDVMARDKNGDVVDADGDKVDVAYLLKRPLVRIRKLSKSLCALSLALDANPVVGKLADDFAELTAQAKRKHQQEQGRLEDESAANIDTTRARNIRTLGPLPGVKVNQTRKVRARDLFSMTIYHSTGQQMDCKIEIVIRDDQPGTGSGGDVLICQVDASGKWLLFAPAEIGCVSARRGETGCDLVIMFRGVADLRSEWHELIALKAEDSEAVADWLNMLGSVPLPPKLDRIPSFSQSMCSKPIKDQTTYVGPTKSLLKTLADNESFDIPIGEPSLIGAKAQDQSNPALAPASTYATQSEAAQSDMKFSTRRKPVPPQKDKIPDPPVTKLSLGGTLQQKALPEHWHQQHKATPLSKLASKARAEELSSVSGYAEQSDRSSMYTDRESTKNTLQAPLAPAKQVQFTPSVLTSALSGTSQLVSETSTSSNIDSTRAQSMASQTLPTPTIEGFTPEKRHDTKFSHADGKRSKMVGDERLTQSEHVPVVAKVRDSSTRKSVSSVPLTDSIREKWLGLSGKGRKSNNVTESSSTEKCGAQTSVDASRASSKVQPKAVASLPSSPLAQQATTPRASSTQSVPITELGVDSCKPDGPVSSSPLKHEYAPSISSESVIEEDTEVSDESSSDTSEDMFSELKDEARSLPDMTRPKKLSLARDLPPPPPTTTGTRTLAPSDSASQGPYRRVPSSATYPNNKTERALAIVCSWSEEGAWEPIQDRECSIVVSPGLVEAFELSHWDSADKAKWQPLVAFELTPIVPLRKGTALDITIRSPATAHSQIKSTSNVMFRSRTMADCDALYRMMNWARCNNPTYLELERARPRPQPVVTFSNQEATRPRSWYSFGKGVRRQNSYRAGSMPPPSMPDSVASSGTMANALTALRRLSKTSAFSLNRSSVIRRPGRATNTSLYSSDNTTLSGSGSGASTPAPPTQVGFIPGKDGPNAPKTSAEAINGAGMVNNVRIKLFIRQGQDWKALGVSRLSVLPAPVMTVTPDVSTPASSSDNTPPASTAPSRRNSALPGQQREYRLPSSSFTPHRIHGNGREKRVLITKDRRPDIVLLDETLGESCFEKVAERGVAVKVWTEDEAMRNQGGVLTGRGRTYMMQFSGQSEASWVFGLCGTYRYSTILQH